MMLHVNCSFCYAEHVLMTYNPSIEVKVGHFRLTGRYEGLLSVEVKTCPEYSPSRDLSRLFE